MRVLEFLTEGYQPIPIEPARLLECLVLGLAAAFAVGLVLF
jgi:hypothetical protein